MADFDPSDHSVADVVAHLEQADDDEQQRVLAEEAGGKNRASLRDWSPAGDEPVTEEQPKAADPQDEVHEFDATEENAVHLLAAVKKLGLRADVVTTLNGRLQAPEAVVRAADITPQKD